jgi:putative ABC transport system ATP-binding protein
MLEKLNDEGVTIVMVTHNPDQGRRAKRRILIGDGKLGRDELVADAERVAKDTLKDEGARHA